MSPTRGLLMMVHTVALGLWLGTLAMAGVAAAVIFPTMKELNPRLPAFEAYAGEHWLIAAGRPQAQVFFIADAVSFAACLFAVVTLAILVWQFPEAVRRAAAAVWAVALGGAVLLLAYNLLVLQPRMSTEITQFWRAAAAGAPEAETHRAAFAADHPTASNVLAGTGLCVLVALCAAAYVSGSGMGGGRSSRRGSGGADAGDPGGAVTGAKLEEPALLRQARP